jgi:hypothetical protein
MQRHTLLWVLRNPNRVVTTDCEAWSDGGATHVVLRRDGDEDVNNDFPDPSTAVRWAMDCERALIAEGWEKLV